MLRILCTPAGLPHYQVSLPASDSGRIVGIGGFGLADLPVSAARIPSVPLHCGPRPPRGSIANPVAPCVWRERTTMEGAGQCSGGSVIAACHAHLNSMLRVRKRL